MNARLALIQLSRYGDIVNILPVARELSRRGKTVEMIVHRDFADILEAVSYVTPVVVAPESNDPEPHATYWELSRLYETVLSTQVDGNLREVPVVCESFAVENWARAGREWVNRYHELPLVFDRREALGEAEAVKRYLPAPDGRPLLAYCLEGYSSAFAERAEFAEWLRTHERAYRMLDIGAIVLPKAHHLLGLIEAADVLVTVDSLPLHLAYATGTPTIALSIGQPHYNSEPRSHWIGWQFYEGAGTEEGRAYIANILREPGRLKVRRGSLCRLACQMYREKVAEPVTVEA